MKVTPDAADELLAVAALVRDAARRLDGVFLKLTPAEREWLESHCEHVSRDTADIIYALATRRIYASGDAPTISGAIQ